MSRQQLLRARKLIQAKRYDDARSILILIDDPIAERWLSKLNQVAPVKPLQDYTLKAIFTLILYWLLWIPGFVVNFIFLREARREQRRTGKKPEGLGCLWALLFANFAFCGVFIIYLMIIGLLSSSGPGGSFIYTLF